MGLNDLLTTERLLILALLFCMGARYIRASMNGHSVEVSGDDEPPKQ